MGIGASLGGAMGGIINAERGQPTIDLTALFESIRKNKEGNELLINDLPRELQPLYEQYKASLGEAGNTLQNRTTDIGKNLLDSTNSLYGPNSAAVQATLAGLRQSDYSTLPGTLDSLKATLAGTGGLSRGGASKALTQAVLQPAGAFSQQSADVMGQQLMTQQKNVQDALNKIASMDDATATAIFGMTKDQAANILQYGRDDLKQKLSQLINNNNSATQAKLGVEGIAANNAYQNAVADNAQQAAIVNGLTTGVGQGIEAYFTGGASEMFGGMGGGGDKGFNPSTQSTPPNGVMQYRPNNGMFAIA